MNNYRKTLLPNRFLARPKKNISWEASLSRIFWAIPNIVRGNFGLRYDVEGGGGVEPLGETPVNGGVFGAKEVFAGTAGGLNASPGQLPVQLRAWFAPIFSTHLPRARRGFGAKATWRAEPPEVRQNLWPPCATRLVTAPRRKPSQVLPGRFAELGEDEQVKRQREAQRENC